MKNTFKEEFGISDTLLNDILDPMVSNFYNQTIDINGFAGIITGAGFLGSPLKLENGINQIPKLLIDSI